MTTDTSELEIFESFWTSPLKKVELSILKSHKGWFDIQMQTPVQRTITFGSVFTEKTREAIRKYFNDAPATLHKNGTECDWNPIKRGGMFDIQEVPERRHAAYMKKIRGVIRARQFLDEVGIPYAFACSFIIDSYFFKDSYLRKFSALPQPSLFDNKALKNKLVLEWVDKIKSRVQYYDHDSMKILDGSSAVAKRHESFLLSQISIHPNKEMKARLFINKGFITEEAAKEHKLIQQ